MQCAWTWSWRWCVQQHALHMLQPQRLLTIIFWAWKPLYSCRPLDHGSQGKSPAYCSSRNGMYVLVSIPEFSSSPVLGCTHAKVLGARIIGRYNFSVEEVEALPTRMAFAIIHVNTVRNEVYQNSVSSEWRWGMRAWIYEAFTLFFAYLRKFRLLTLRF